MISEKYSWKTTTYSHIVVLPRVRELYHQKQGAFGRIQSWHNHGMRVQMTSLESPISSQTKEVVCKSLDESDTPSALRGVLYPSLTPHMLSAHTQ